jgi:hypothetical protein
MSASEKRFFRCVNVHSPRAAGVSPPWFCDTNVVQREAHFVQRLANGRTRAVGVSPPWFWSGERSRQCVGNARALACAKPRGAYAPRSWIAVRMSAGEKRFLRCVNVHSPRAAGVSPPWFGFALATATGFCGVIMFRPAHSPPLPRLVHASRSWLHAHKSPQMHAGALQRRIVPHGGLTPPALVLQCACLPVKNDFCDA